MDPNFLNVRKKFGSSYPAGNKILKNLAFHRMSWTFGEC